MLVTLRGVSHTYGDRADPVLASVDLDIPRGALIALSGPSGSGKTTLLQLVGGLMSPTTGSVVSGTSDGEDPVRISWVFQGSNALLGRTVIDNVALPLLIAGSGRADIVDRCGEALAAVGLGGFEHRVARTMSGGELQRMTIARALVSAPDLILADEPTGQLDAANTDRIADVLVAIRDDHRTVVIATHDERLAAACDHVVAIDSGRVSVHGLVTGATG